MTEDVMKTSKKPRFSFVWSLIASPLAALVWLGLFLANPLYQDYLRTAKTYLVNYKLLGVCLGMILCLTWIVHSLLPANQEGNKPSLLAIMGTTAFFGIVSHYCDIVGEYFAFYTGFLGSELCALLANCILVFWIYRLFIARYLPDYKGSCSRLALTISMPCIFLMSWQYLQSNKFFAEQIGRYPQYNAIIYYAPNMEGQSMKEFLQEKKSSDLPAK